MKTKLLAAKIAAGLLLAALLTGCQTNTFTVKHFPERVARIHTVALWPQIHTAMLDTYFGRDPSPAPLPEEPQIRAELIAATTDQLQQRGFVVKEGSFPDATNHIWNGLKIQQACATPISKAARPDAKALADNVTVDGLIFLDATAYKSTPHRQNVTTPQNIIALIGAMTGGGDASIAWRDAVLQITLVDGETGDALWTTAGHFHDFDKNKPSKAVADLFNRYPKPKP